MWRMAALPPSARASRMPACRGATPKPCWPCWPRPRRYALPSGRAEPGMTETGWRIVPLDEARLAQWATLRQQLWPHHGIAAHLQEGGELLTNAGLNAFLALDEQDQAVGFADAALRHDYVNGCESSPVVYLEGVYVQ